MKCKLEPDLKCGGGWRNSIFKVTPYIPQDKKAAQAKELNASIKSIIADIDDARKDAQKAYQLSKNIAWITGADMRRLQSKKEVGLKSGN